MNNFRTSKIYTLLVILITSCSTSKLQNRNHLAFIPEDYMLYDRIDTDLNNDQIKDCILVIKATNTNKIVINRFDKQVDRNRRGIIVLFKKGNRYKLVDKNYDCFYSENEDGGVYYAPQLSIETHDEDIIFNYEHGRYGHWSYTFRFLDNSYKLIAYNGTSSFGSITKSITELNFLTKQKIYKESINEEDEGNDEVFKETKSTINLEELIELSEIKDFEDLNIYDY